MKPFGWICSLTIYISSLGLSFPAVADAIRPVSDWQVSLSGGLSTAFAGVNLPPPITLQGTWTSPWLEKRFGLFWRARLFFFAAEPPALAYLELGPRYTFYRSKPIDIYAELGFGAVGSSNSRFLLAQVPSSENAGYTWGYTITPNLGADIALTPQVDLNLQGGVATHFAGMYTFGAAGLSFNF